MSPPLFRRLSERIRVVHFAFLAALLSSFIRTETLAAGGPLGIDQRWNYDDSGIWSRSTQSAVLNGLMLANVAGALWEGGDTRLGKTFWYSLDSLAVGSAATEILKRAFSRERPRTTDNPNQWFKGSGNLSFPSGDVSAITSMITPFVLEYREEYPAVYALELLPLYDGIARIKVRAHWQADVLGAFAVGTAAGYLMHARNAPFLLSVLPDGFEIGLKKRF